MLARWQRMREAWRKRDTVRGRETARRFFWRSIQSNWQARSSLVLWAIPFVILLFSTVWATWLQHDDTIWEIQRIAERRWARTALGQYIRPVLYPPVITFAIAIWAVLYMAVLIPFIVFAINGMEVLNKIARDPMKTQFKALQTSLITRQEWVHGMLMATMASSRIYLYMGVLGVFVPSLIYLFSPVNAYVIKQPDYFLISRPLAHQLWTLAIGGIFLTGEALLLHYFFSLRQWRQLLRSDSFIFQTLNFISGTFQIIGLHVFGIAAALAFGGFEDGLIYHWERTFHPTLPNNFEIHTGNMITIALLSWPLVIIFILVEVRKLEATLRRTEF